MFNVINAGLLVNILVLALGISVSGIFSYVFGSAYQENKYECRLRSGFPFFVGDPDS